MKKSLLFIICIIAAFTSISAKSLYKSNDIAKVAITEQDIPSGFIMGKIPEGVKHVLKDNPWNLDGDAIKRLSDKIYPNGDYRKVAGIHMTIIADEKKPFNDNMVCYIIVYKGMDGAKEEISKLNRYVGFNSDRALLLQKDNIAVFLHADDVKDFHYIQDLAAGIQVKLKDL